VVLVVPWVVRHPLSQEQRDEEAVLGLVEAVVVELLQLSVPHWQA
tara:strand:+ start:182 stop:316 length:135 start_codon:yes stop_codon:yes gene_type:complete